MRFFAHHASRRTENIQRLLQTTAVACLCAAWGGCEKKQPAIVSKPAIVTVARPIEKEVIDYAEYTGRTSAMETVEVRARVGGFIEKINFKDGSVVAAGDVLVEIDARPFKAAVDQAQAELEKSKAVLEKADVEWERLDKLYQKKTASVIEWSTAKAAKHAAEAMIAAAQANLETQKLNLDWTKVTAPISGRIGRRLVDTGNLITGGTSLATPLATILQLQPIYVYFDVDERTVLTLQTMAREGKLKAIRDGGRVPVELGTATDQGYPYNGEVDFIDNKVDPNTGTLRVRAMFPNDPYILSDGLFVRCRFPIGPPHRALLVSERALGQDQGQYFALVVASENKVDYRPLKIGTLHNGLRVIESGLKPDEWVIVNGLQRVRPGATVEPQRVEMASQVAASAASAAPADSTPTTASAPAGR